jgi:2-keto-3-deoxy-L-rhamnonate aldolase RhmA
MNKNRLRELLKQGKPTLGTHVISTWPGIIEVIGQTGAFDYIEYVGEYSSFSLEQMDNFGRAIELFPSMSGMMKVEEQTRGFIAARAIDSGIQNVLFTDCRSADDVRECIRYVRPETPQSRGVHGYGMRRSTGYGYGSQVADWTRAMDEVVVAIMIEKKGAIENLEEILSVKGVDMVQFGPVDYSISIGMPGQVQSKEVQDAHKYMIEAALKKSVAPRVEIGSFEQAKPYVDMGVRHFCIGWDTSVIAAWCKQQADGMATFLK